MKKVLRKGQTLSSFHQLVWRDMSKYIRQKYADWRGLVRCYTCDKIMRWQDSDCGHLRHLDALDFNQDNLRPQCTNCNRFESGRRDIFYRKLVKEIGKKRAEALYRINIYSFTLTELRAIREKIKGS